MTRFSKEKVLLLHKLITEETGGSSDLRDIGLLDSALSSAFQSFSGKELYPTIEEKAARTGLLLISNHAFVDGNKRIGMLAMMTILEINGVRFDPTDEEITRVGFAVASGEMGYEDLLKWIYDNEN